MAVYTHLSVPETAAWLDEHYALGKLVAMEGITQGVENTNYKLTLRHQDTERPYILTLYEKRVRVEDVPYYLELMAQAKLKGCDVPDPQRRRDGALCGRIAGKMAAITSFLPGQNMPRATSARLHELGRAVAQMHEALADFPQIRANDLSPFALEGLLARCGTGLDRLEPGLHAAMEDELAWLKFRTPVLPIGQIHADLFPDNVFFDGDRLTGLIDFYFACTDSLAYDLAVILNSWCMDEFSGTMDASLNAALVEGYECLRPLTQEERAALPLLARGAAVRFLLTRAHDWIHQVPGAMVVVKEPSEYLRKWRTHQNATPAEYGV